MAILVCLLVGAFLGYRLKECPREVETVYRDDGAADSLRKVLKARDAVIDSLEQAFRDIETDQKLIDEKNRIIRAVDTAGDAWRKSYFAERYGHLLPSDGSGE